MKISYVSDLHSEFGIKDLELPGGDVLLLAGDIVVIRGLTQMNQHYTDHHKAGNNHVYHQLMKNQFSKYKQVLSVMGNHEHYRGDMITDKQALVHETTQYPYFSLLENQVHQIAAEWMLFGATMWTDYNHADPQAMIAASMGLNDHRLILNADSRFRPHDAYNLNEQSRTELARALENYPDKNWIIMTHHTPSMLSSHPKWGKEKNLLNYAFCNVDLLEPFVDSYPQIKYWVHGHTHDSMDYQYKGCRVLCNPRGYGTENAKDFDPNKHFVIEDK